MSMKDAPVSKEDAPVSMEDASVLDEVGGVDECRVELRDPVHCLLCRL